MPSIRTVLGDIAPGELGVCDAHDHLFLRMPRFAGQELDDPAAAAEELRLFHDAGGQTLVQWTPFGLGRRADALAELSRSTGVHVIAATGLHQAEHYDPAVLDRVRPRLADLFIDELTNGIHHNGDTPPVRAGLIKVAGSFHHLDEHARRTMVAAARAHQETGAPIGIHLELGTAALDVIDLLCANLNVPPSGVILGHLNRHPELRILRQAAESGTFLAFDGPSRANHATDWRLLDLLTALVDAGHADQLLLGGDTTTAAARAATDGGPGIPYLLTNLRPRLDRELGSDLTAKIFVANPARAFAWRE